MTFLPTWAKLWKPNEKASTMNRCHIYSAIVTLYRKQIALFLWGTFWATAGLSCVSNLSKFDGGNVSNCFAKTMLIPSVTL